MNEYSKNVRNEINQIIIRTNNRHPIEIINREMNFLSLKHIIDFITSPVWNLIGIAIGVPRKGKVT